MGVLCGRRGTVEPFRDRADRLDQAVLIDPEVAGQRRGGRLPGQHEHRGAALGRLGQAGHRVGQPGSLVDRADRELAADAAVAVGHPDRAVLMARGVKAHAVGAHRVGHDEVAAAENAERVGDSLGRDRLADDVGYRSLRALHGPIMTARVFLSPPER